MVRTNSSYLGMIFNPIGFTKCEVFSCGDSKLENFLHISGVQLSGTATRQPDQSDRSKDRTFKSRLPFAVTITQLRGDGRAVVGG